MKEFEAILEEVAREVLGLPQKSPPPLPFPKEEARPLILGKGPAGLPRLGEGKPPAPQGPPAPDREVLRRLGELERRFQKKVQEVEGLKAKLQREKKARQEAERARQQALEATAHLRKALAQAVEEKDRLAAKLAAALAQGAELRRAKEALEEEAKVYRERLQDLEARLKALEETRPPQLEALKARLPGPFPEEALFRVLVLDYPRLGEEPGERVRGLLEGYRAFLEGREHPALEHSNRAWLLGEPEGVVLLGLEGLLRDLASLPLLRWLRAYAFRLEAFLQGEGGST